MSAGWIGESLGDPGGGNDGLFGRTGVAWSRYRDHIYADSFGNLVIQSPSGYKRIIVGQGHLAKELSSYESAGATHPDVVYLDDSRTATGAIAIATGRLIPQGPQLHVRFHGRPYPSAALRIEATRGWRGKRNRSRGPAL